MRDHLLKGEGP